MKMLHTIHTLDVTAFTWCMARKNRQVFTNASRIISKTADGPGYVLLGALLWFYGEQDICKALAVAFVAERLLYFVLKNSFKRNRPEQAIQGFHSFIRPSDKFSFPSGHTSAAFLMSAFLYLLFPAAAPFVYCWAASVALARIFLGVHFPTDTLMGMLLGTGTALIVIEAMIL